MFNMLKKNNRKIACALFMIISIISLSGCQKYIQPVPPTTTTPNIKKDYFSIQGKIGVKTSQQSGSAFFDWQQQGKDFRIDLTGILGLGKTHIESMANQVSLTSARTGTIYADSPEELLEQATGWQAPITYLVSWVQGASATPQAIIERDSGRRITQIKEDGWIISLFYTDLNMSPSKLILRQPLPNNQENRITMIIQNS